MTGNLYLDANFVKAEIAKLREAYPEMAEDESLLFGMLEGETDAFRLLDRLVAARLDDKAMAAAAKERETALADRRARYDRAAEAKDRLIKSILKSAGVNKLPLPEATISLIKPRMSVGIADVNDLPQGYFRTKREADKDAIKLAIEAGETIPGAFLVLGSEGLRIQPK